METRRKEKLFSFSLKVLKHNRILYIYYLTRQIIENIVKKYLRGNNRDAIRMDCENGPMFTEMATENRRHLNMDIFNYGVIEWLRN